MFKNLKKTRFKEAKGNMTSYQIQSINKETEITKKKNTPELKHVTIDILNVLEKLDNQFQQAQEKKSVNYKIAQ